MVIPQELIDKALEKVDNRFLLVLLAAKRARQIEELGVETGAKKEDLFRGVMNEIIDGKMKIKVKK